jgi:PucR family transcriptional regulator, proline-responsive transcriptional activator
MNLIHQFSGGFSFCISVIDNGIYRPFEIIEQFLPPNGIIILILLGGVFMFVHCYELMEISSFKNIHLVAGESGLDRKVSWVYVLQTPSLEDWVHGGEFMFVVNNKNIYKILQEAVSHQLSGVVVLKSKHNESNLNTEIINFANKENMPLFEMEYHIRLIDITREISNYIIHKEEKTDYLKHFFYNILFLEDLAKKEIDEYATQLGYHNEHECFITIINSKDTTKIKDIKLCLLSYVNNPDVNYIYMILGSSIVILTFTVPNFIKKAKNLLKAVYDILNEKYSDMLCMAIGNTCQSLYDVRHSYFKAMKALPLCTKENRIIDYDELGFPRLILNATNQEDLKEYAAFTLGKIKEYDEKNQTSFLQTMEAYILCNGNISKTSAKLYIHRNTCVYRLARVKELFNMDLDDPYIRANILNCLYIIQYLDSI